MYFRARTLFIVMQTCPRHLLQHVQEELGIFETLRSLQSLLKVRVGIINAIFVETQP